MEKIRIALAGLKGGIGKTTLSMAFGSILQQTYKKRVCYVDCDYFQYPITAQNQREQIFYDRNLELGKEVFASRSIDFEARTLPTIFKMNEGFENNTLPDVVERTYPDFDIYIYDFMGSQGYEDTYHYLTYMDYIVLPTVIDAVNSKPTFYWMSGVSFAKNMAKEKGQEVRNKDVFLLFNNFSDDACDFEMKAWLEDQATKFGIKTLQNMVRRYNGVARDISCISDDNRDFFISLNLQPSPMYAEVTHILQVAEELFLKAGIITEELGPRVIDDPLELHNNILEDIKEQLKEMEDLTERVNGDMSELSGKHRDLLVLYQRLTSMSVEDIKEAFGRKVYNPAHEDSAESSDASSVESMTEDQPQNEKIDEDEHE